MPQLIKAQYEKHDAIFANGADARADKDSLFPPELTESITESNNDALAAGILLEPIYPEWDQVTFTLSVCKLTSSAEEFENTRTYSGQLCVEYAVEAGWTFLGLTITDVE
jgi:hypothetical protein